MRRRAIAKAVVVEQKTPAMIGRELGISRQMVNVELRADETRQFIRSAMAPYLDDLRDLIPQAIAAVKDTLKSPFDAIADAAEKGTPQEALKCLNTPVDRIRAVRALGWMMQWAEGKASEGDHKPVADRFSGTLEDLLITHRETIYGAEVDGPL